MWRICIIASNQVAYKFPKVVLPENPNHANVIGWPAEKPAQKIIAQQIAAAVDKSVPAPYNSG